MAVTEKKWKLAGETLNRRARQQMKRQNVSYSEALAGVLRKDKKLSAAYHKAPAKDPLARLRELADYLNGETSKPKRQRHPLLEILTALKQADAGKEDVARARSMLEKNLERLHVQCVPIFSRKAGMLGLIYPAGHYGTIIKALHDGTYSSLHCCRWCNNFFVHKDHRRDYCTTRCFKERETYRVKLWRSKREG